MSYEEILNNKVNKAGYIGTALAAQCSYLDNPNDIGNLDNFPLSINGQINNPIIGIASLAYIGAKMFLNNKDNLNNIASPSRNDLKNHGIDCNNLPENIKPLYDFISSPKDLENHLKPNWRDDLTEQLNKRRNIFNQQNDNEIKNKLDF